MYMDFKGCRSQFNRKFTYIIMILLLLSLYIWFFVGKWPRAARPMVPPTVWRAKHVEGCTLRIYGRFFDFVIKSWLKCVVVVVVGRYTYYMCIIWLDPCRWWLWRCRRCFGHESKTFSGCSYHPPPMYTVYIYI